MYKSHKIVNYWFDSHNYEAPPKEWAVWLALQLLSEKTQWVAQTSPGKARQVTNGNVCQLLNTRKLFEKFFPVAAGVSLCCVA